MIIIANSAPVSTLIHQPSGKDNGIIPKEATHIIIADASVNEDGKETTANAIIILPEEVESLFTYANVINLKEYKLERICTHNNNIIFKAVHDQNNSVDVVVNNTIYVNLESDRNITAHLTNEWLFWLNRGEIRLKNKEINVNYDEIDTEFEGTPVACVRWAIPNIIRTPYLCSDNCTGGAPGSTYDLGKIAASIGSAHIYLQEYAKKKMIRPKKS